MSRIWIGGLTIWSAGIAAIVIAGERLRRAARRVHPGQAWVMLDDGTRKPVDDLDAEDWKRVRAAIRPPGADRICGHCEGMGETGGRWCADCYGQGWSDAGPRRAPLRAVRTHDTAGWLDGRLRRSRTGS